MNGIYQNYQIDLSGNNNFVQYNTVQGDGNGVRGFEVELIEHNKPYILGDDVEVFIAGTKPDTKQIFNSCEVTEQGTILIDVTTQMSAVTGRGDYQIVLISKTTNQQLKSFPFILFVKEAAFDAETITSSDEFQALSGMVNKIESTFNKTDFVDSMLDSSAQILEDTTAAYDNAVKSLEKAQNAIDTAESINSTAQESADNAKQSEENSLSYSNIAKSYAVGTDNIIRENDSTDNAKCYKEQAELSSASALQSANLAGQKATDACAAETNTQQYAANAYVSETNAKESEENAVQSAASAVESKAAAEQSALSAKASEEAAADSATDADNSALMAKSYSDGKTGIREGEDTDCARFYKEKAEEAAEKAEQVTNISIATPETPGLVKPDGTTITVDEDGTLRGADTVQVDGTTIMKAENVIKLADALKTLIDNSVQQVTGKGLSANDFTDALLGKLNEIEAQATKVLIADDFDTDEEGFALSARKGKALYYSKIDREDVMDNLLSTDKQKPLSANMGKTLNDKINDVSNGILNRVYPVGSVYISFIYNPPSNFIGGVWEQLENVFLYASTSNIGVKGGEASHQLTVNELPSHQHGIPQLEGNTDTAGEHSHKYGSSSDLAAPGSNHGTAFQASGYDTSASGAHQHTFKTNTSNTGYTGATVAHNNMPPYIIVYMWRRIA